MVVEGKRCVSTSPTKRQQQVEAVFQEACEQCWGCRERWISCSGCARAATVAHEKACRADRALAVINPANERISLGLIAK